MERAQDVRIEREPVGALAKEPDLVLEGQHEELVLPEELAESAILGQKLQRLAGGPVRARAELTQLVPFDPAKAQETEVEQRLVPDDPDVVGKSADAVEHLPAAATLLLDELAHERGQEGSPGVHDARDALVRVDVRQQQRAPGQDAEQVLDLEPIDSVRTGELASGVA